MKRALVLRHVLFEDLGGFAEPIEAAGYAIASFEAGVDDLTRLDPLAPDLLVVLGGPIGAYEEALYPFLDDERRLLGARLAAKRPTLGVCLGAQLMARALDAPVYPGSAREIGWAPVTLTPNGKAGPLRHLARLPLLHWHGDTFDLPANALRLASTQVCANQAFAIGDHALAFQFHPEADGAGFERWLIGHAHEIASVSGLSVTALRDDARRFGPAAGRAGRACLAEWLSNLA